MREVPGAEGPKVCLDDRAAGFSGQFTRGYRFVTPGDSSRSLPDHSGWVLVPSRALKPRMAKLPCVGPLAERHLPDEPRLDPVHTGPRHSAPNERGLYAFQAGQRAGETGQGGIIEASADLSGIGEFAALVVVSEQKGAESGPRSLGVGEAADDELLVGLALELQPVPRTAGPVGGVPALDHQAFPPDGTGAGIVRLAILRSVGHVPDRPFERQE